MRQILSVLVIFCALHGWGQACVWKAHPVWPDTLGHAVLDYANCANGIPLVPSCQWDNGDTSLDTDSLTVGAHHVVIFDNSVPQDTVYFEIEQLAWDLNQNVFVYAGAITVEIWAELPYCASMFNGYNCHVYGDSTVIHLLQDGIAMDSITPVDICATLAYWDWLPFGHTYQTYLVDRSACGSTAYGETVVSFALDAEIEYWTEPSTGSNDGMITVTDILAAPGMLSPPPMPLSGGLMLYTWPDEVAPVGPPQPGTTATWTDLAPGDYLVVFTPDVLCNSVDTVITVGSFTGVDDREGTVSERRVWPVPATDVLFWSGGALEHVWVTDLQGRTVLEGKRTSHLDIAGLVPGSYLVHFGDGGRRSFVKD